jgi:preprotein translocase subunit SecA
MGERIGLDILNMMYDASKAIVEDFRDAGDYEGLKLEVYRVFAIELPFEQDVFKSEKEEKLTDRLFHEVLDAFKRKNAKLAHIAYPVVKDVFENQGAMYENILIPISDGKRVYNITCNLKAAYESEGKELQKAFQKSILLYTIDEAWKEHLREMDELRQSVRNASYEQKDPLLIYKLESFGLFKAMVDDVNRKTVSILMRGQVPMREEPVRQAAPERKQDFSKYRTQKDEFGGNSSNTAEQRQPERRIEPVRVEKKIGRNDLCPCGSGQKFKNCHGKGQE